MKPLHALAFLALAAAPAMAQTYYPDRTYDDRLSRDEYRTCVDRQHVLRDRREAIEDERSEADREAADIARAGAALDAELRHLDRNNPEAVAAYNARSERHNRRVDRQNRHV